MLKTNLPINPFSTLIVFVTLLFILCVSYGLSVLFMQSIALHWMVMIVIYFWTLFKPQALPLWSTFIIGLLLDGLEFTPFGFYAFGLLLLQNLAYHQQQYLLRRPFRVIWAGFAIDTSVVIFVLSIFMWFRDMVIDERTFFSLCFVWMAFPFVYVLMNKLLQKLTKKV